MPDKPILFVKAGCPWCAKALEFFASKKIALDTRDVSRDSAAMARMVKLTGQTKTPTMEYGDFVVADFAVDEFLVAVGKRPDVKAALGL